MPIYEFRCKKCEHEFSIQQKMNDEHVSNCPKCESSDTVRVFTPPIISLKSEQWHAARSIGVSKNRLETSSDLRDQRDKRKKDPRNERDLISNELHLPDPTKGPKRKSESK